MNSLNNNDKELSKLLNYSVLEAPAELEFLVKKSISEEVVIAKPNSMGLVAGWIPFTISVVGLIFGILSSIIIFFPEVTSVLSIVGNVLAFILNPSVMIIAISVFALILVDSLLEKRIGKTVVKIG